MAPGLNLRRGVTSCMKQQLCRTCMQNSVFVYVETEMSHRGSSVLNVPNRLVSSLFSQKEVGKFCDIVLWFGEVELSAHACVVASFSPFVDNLVSSLEVMPSLTDKQSSSCIVPLKDSEFSCISCAKKVIDFMYIGKIQIVDVHLEHIKIISEALQVSELLKICEKHHNKCHDSNKTEIKSQETVPKLSQLLFSDQIKDEDIKISNKPSSPKVLSQPSLPDSPRKSVACEMTVTQTSLGEDVMDETEWSGIKCPKCDSLFMSLAKYQQHCSTHLGKTYTSCYVCSYASIKVLDVIKHLQEKNHGEKVCSICLLEVSSSKSLKEHIQIHDQAQPFFCLTCNTRFQTRTALNSHIVRHTNETPFVCKECGRGFKWKHGLRSHMVTHSKMKAFLCDQCGYSTAHLRSFIDHKTAHSGEKFKCPKPDCQFSSVRKESVKHHLMTHSKQRPFQCEICGQAFTQCKNLRRHAASHNPSADIEKCPLCAYQTNRSDKFKAHFKRYHKVGEEIEINQRKRKKSSSLSSTPEVSNQRKKTKSSSASIAVESNQRKRKKSSASSSFPVEINKIADFSNPHTFKLFGAASCTNLEVVKSSRVLECNGGTCEDPVTAKNSTFIHMLAGTVNPIGGFAENMIQNSAKKCVPKNSEAESISNRESNVFLLSENCTDGIYLQCSTDGTSDLNNPKEIIKNQFTTRDGSESTSVQSIVITASNNLGSAELIESSEEPVCGSAEQTSDSNQPNNTTDLSLHQAENSCSVLDDNSLKEQVIIVGADSSSSDPVFVIPDGAYVIMDTDFTIETAPDQGTESSGFFLQNSEPRTQEFSLSALNEPNEPLVSSSNKNIS